MFKTTWPGITGPFKLTCPGVTALPRQSFFGQLTIILPQGYHTFPGRYYKKFPHFIVQFCIGGEGV